MNSRNFHCIKTKTLPFVFLLASKATTFIFCCGILFVASSVGALPTNALWYRYMQRNGAGTVDSIESFTDRGSHSNPLQP